MNAAGAMNMGMARSGRIAAALALGWALALGGCGPRGPVEDGETVTEPVPDALGPAERYGLSDADIAGLAPDALVRKALDKSDVDTLDAAAAEDPLSVGLLCMAHYYGVETPRDDAAAADACARAHAARAPLGAYMLSLVTRPADAARADALLKEAADAGDARAQGDIVATQRARNPAAARAMAERCAAQGSQACQFALAQMKAAGEGGPKDPVGARTAYETLAAAYHAPSVRELGKFWRDGVGVPTRDIEEAVIHFKRAAVLDDGEASYLLGELAEAGDGLPRSEADALAFYKDAAADGYAPAAAKIAQLQK